VCCAESVLSERDSLAAAVISGVGEQEGGGRLGASDLVVGEDGLSGDGQEGGVAGALRTKPHAVIIRSIVQNMEILEKRRLSEVRETRPRLH
jgi:hypothetical protein